MCHAGKRALVRRPGPDSFSHGTRNSPRGDGFLCLRKFTHKCLFYRFGDTPWAGCCRVAGGRQRIPSGGVPGTDRPILPGRSCKIRSAGRPNGRRLPRRCTPHLQLCQAKPTTGRAVTGTPTRGRAYAPVHGLRCERSRGVRPSARRYRSPLTVEPTWCAGRGCTGLRPCTAPPAPACR